MPQNKARTVDFKPNERNVFFHILTPCNLSCRHCYINREQHGKGQVSKKNITAWLDLFLKTDRQTNLILLGGEPTLHKELPYAIRYARKLGCRSITVDTNGFLFHDFLDQVSTSDLDYLSFSLDGPDADVNDAIRGTGVFSVCTTNLARAVDKGFSVSVIYTVSSHNIDHLKKMPALLKSLGVKRFFIQVIGLRGKSTLESPSDLQINPEEWLAKIPPVAQAAAGQGIHVIYPKVFLDEHEVFACAGNVAENYFIFPNGRVYLCPLCEDYPIHTFRIEHGKLLNNCGLVEKKLFSLTIPEGCVMNKLLQPGNLRYDKDGRPCYRISCCLLKQEYRPAL